MKKKAKVKKWVLMHYDIGRKPMEDDYCSGPDGQSGGVRLPITRRFRPGSKPRPLDCYADCPNRWYLRAV